MSKFNIGDKVQFRYFNDAGYYVVHDIDSYNTATNSVNYILAINGYPLRSTPVSEELLIPFDEADEAKQYERRRAEIALFDLCRRYIENDEKAVKEAAKDFLNSNYGLVSCGHTNSKTITKIITNYKLDNKPGIYTTVQFGNRFVTVKKSLNDKTLIDLHVACAFAYTKLRFGAHSRFKKTVDRKIQDITDNYKFFQWFDGYKEISITIPKDVDDIYEFIAVSIFNDYLGRNSSNMECYKDAVKKMEDKE